MKLLFTIIASFLFCSCVIGQKATFYTSLGGGSSTFKKSWSAYNSYSFVKKNNVLTLSLWYSSETGNKLPGLVYPEFYNDHFWDLGLLYGKLYLHQNWLHTSLSAGPSYYIYIDKEIGGRTKGFISTLTTTKEKHDGIGLTLKGEVLFILGDEFGLGLNFLGNINSHKIIGGAILNMTFGILRTNN